MLTFLLAALIAAAPAAERQVTIPGPNGASAGVLRDAGADAPVLLVVPERGRDPRRLAGALANRGVATLRIDEPAEVARWAAEAKRLTGAGCIWVAGEGESARLALSAATEAARLCGVIAINPPAAGGPAAARFEGALLILRVGKDGAGSEAWSRAKPDARSMVIPRAEDAAGMADAIAAFIFSGGQ